MADIGIPTKSPPEHKIRAGNIEVAIWRNTVPEGKSYYTYTLTKSFKKDDEWRNTQTLSKNDLPKAILALQKAFEYSTLKKNAKEIIAEEMEEVGEESVE